MVFEADGNALIISAIDDVANLVTSSKVLASCLDTPSVGVVVKSDKIAISGWVVLKAYHPSIKVLIGESVFDLNKKRPDVVSAILNASPETSEQLTCGFLVELSVQDISSELSLSFSVDEEYLPWKHIKLIRANDDKYKAGLIFDRYLKNNLDQISASEALFVEQVASQGQGFIIEAPEIVYFDAEQASRKSSIKPIEKDNFKSFLHLLCSRDFADILVSSAIEHGACVVVNPFSDGVARCLESFSITNLTVLRFITDSNEAFFIVQQATSADLVYFPNRKLAVVLMHASFDLLRNVLFDLGKQFSKLLNYSKGSFLNSFRGVVASFPRPHHFYYEIIHGMDTLNNSGTLSNINEIIYGVGAGFYSFKGLYGLDCIETVVDFKTLNTELLEGKDFVVHVGVGYKQEYDKFLLEIDSVIVDHALHSVDADKKLEIDTARSCFPLILLGVAVEKRKWIQQVDGLIEVINRVSKVFPGAGFVFDGWTTPIIPTPYDENQIKLHNEVVDCIKEKTSCDTTKFFSVIGANSAYKIAFSLAVDCFVANSVTGSLHVARFAKKPGVGHNCKAMKRIPEHPDMRPYIKFVEDDYIIDIEDRAVNMGSIASEFVSYSIDPEVIVSMLLDILKKDSVKNRFESTSSTDY